MKIFPFFFSNIFKIKVINRTFCVRMTADREKKTNQKKTKPKTTDRKVQKIALRKLQFSGNVLFTDSQKKTGSCFFFSMKQ